MLVPRKPVPLIETIRLFVVDTLLDQCYVDAQLNAIFLIEYHRHCLRGRLTTEYHRVLDQRLNNSMLILGCNLLRFRGSPS